MAAFPFVDASGPRLALIALAFGGTTAFLVAGAVMLTAGAFALAAIRPERDARRLGLDAGPQP
ncbi:hypothetical protein [Streptomyces sp. NPDC058579]|uniref:hypothetical protein n=1 Tax=Streptomyces sp. NPDC058579 TaxID=3346548 RepID=UPI00364F787A